MRHLRDDGTEHLPVVGGGGDGGGLVCGPDFQSRLVVLRTQWVARRVSVGVSVVAIRSPEGG